MALHQFTSAAQTDKSAATRLIDGMRNLGWTPVAYHDGEERVPLDGCWTTSAVVLQLMQTDEAHLYFRKPGNGEMLKGTMLFVFGNSPWEVMADSSMDEGEWDADLKLAEEAANLEGV